MVHLMKPTNRLCVTNLCANVLNVGLAKSLLPAESNKGRLMSLYGFLLG